MFQGTNVLLKYVKSVLKCKEVILNINKKSREKYTRLRENIASENETQRR